MIFVNSHRTVEFVSKARRCEGKIELKSKAQEYYRLLFQSEGTSRNTIAFDFYITDKLLKKISKQEEFILAEFFSKITRNLDMFM